MIILTEDHKYIVDGKVTPGVNEILEDLGFQDKRWMKPEHAERGKVVHTLCDEYDREGKFPSGDYNGYVVAWAQFMEDSKYTWESIEVMMAHPLGYAGTIDRYDKTNNAVVDIKTGSHLQWHYYQLVAYAEMVGATEGVMVYINRDASYKMVTFPIDRYRKHWEYILGCYKVKHYAR